MDFIEVTINKWAKHQPRKDIKHPNWFALSNRMLEDSKLFSLSSAEIHAFIYVLSIASQQNSAAVLINIEHARKVCRIRRNVLLSALDKLDRLGVTSAWSMRTDPYLDTTYNTLQDKTDTLLPTRTDRRVFDFDILYAAYPRKEGKHRGLVTCKAQIKTDEDYLNLKLAIERYAEFVKTHATEIKFIKHFSSFMTSWRDWLDPLTGIAQKQITRGIADIMGSDL